MHKIRSLIAIIFAGTLVGCAPYCDFLGAKTEVAGDIVPVADTNLRPGTSEVGDPSSKLAPTLTYSPGDSNPPANGNLIPDVSPGLNDGTVPLGLTILAPAAGFGTEVGAIRVLGKTSAGTEVTVNGVPTNVGQDGAFQQDLVIQEGINNVDAKARNALGEEASENLVILFVPRAVGVPLSVLFPHGLEVSEPSIRVMGATIPGTVVGVNGTPVEINEFGIFSTDAPLEEGTNLVEVVAVDFEGQVNFQTLFVFYIP